MPHQCTNCGKVFDDGSKEMLSGCPGCGGNKFQYHPGAVPDEPSEDEPPERPGDGGVTGTVGKAAAKVRDFVGDDDPARATASNSDTPAGGADSSHDDRVTADDRAATADDTPSPSESNASAATRAAVDDEARDSEEVPDRDDEDLAQQSARSEMVSDGDLPHSDRPGATTDEEGETPAADQASPGEQAPPGDQPPSSDRGRVVSEPSGDDRPDMEQLREELNSQFESIRIVSPGTYELNLMELYDREEYIIALQENGRYVIEVPDAWEVEDADEDE